MWWFIAWIFLIASIITGDSLMLIASAIFAVAGEICIFNIKYSKANEQSEKIKEDV